MPMIGSPLVASRPEPVRAVRVPERVKQAIVTMVETGADFVSAGKQHGVTAQMMRRWLGRAECISYLRKQRAQFRTVACAGNEACLVSIRDGVDGNQMARVAAVKVLAGLENDEVARPSNAPSPGVTIVIRHAAEPMPPRDITPANPLIEAD
jgi:hypothetical protein